MRESVIVSPLHVIVSIVSPLHVIVSPLHVIVSPLHVIMSERSESNDPHTEIIDKFLPG